MEYYNKITPEYINALHQSVIYPVFKVELMSHNEVVFGEIQQDLNAEGAGSISINYQQGVRRTCSITLIGIDKKYIPDPNGTVWIGTKFKIYIGIKIKNPKLITSPNPNAEDTIYWFSQGVFVVTDPSIQRDGSNVTVTLNGVDKFGLFGSETGFNATEGTYLIPAGTTVENIIQDILLMDRGNGTVIDPTPPIIDPSIGQQEIPYDIQKSPETYFSEILTELGNIFACDIFYDTDGRLNFVKGNEQINMNDYSPLWEYTDVLPEYFTPNNTYDFVNAYNVVKVVGNNTNSAIYETTLKNTEPSSPTRVQLIGEKIKYVESTFCYNAARTNDFAHYLLRKYSIVQQSFGFESSLIPHLEVNNVITISDKYFNYDLQRFVIQELEIPLSTNTLMTVTASNCSNIPYFEY